MFEYKINHIDHRAFAKTKITNILNIASYGACFLGKAP